MSRISNENYSAKEYFENIVQDSLAVFNELITWSHQDMDEYCLLLDKLKRSYDRNAETTKSKGDRLENLVSFVINKSYFFEVSRNVHTGTNEIDQVITLSKKGKQALAAFNISKDLLEINSDIALGECKNYNTTLNVTYVGKFYSLLASTDVPFGIIFTQNGLTGSEDEFHDAYGLVKVLRIIEKYRNGKDLFILTFTLKDYELLKTGVSFFELVRTKKLALQLSSEYDSLIKEYKHENEQLIKEIIHSIK